MTRQRQPLTPLTKSQTNIKAGTGKKTKRDSVLVGNLKSPPRKKAKKTRYDCKQTSTINQSDLMNSKEQNIQNTSNIYTNETINQYRIKNHQLALQLNQIKQIYRAKTNKVKELEAKLKFFQQTEQKNQQLERELADSMADARELEKENTQLQQVLKQNEQKIKILKQNKSGNLNNVKTTGQSKSVYETQISALKSEIEKNKLELEHSYRYKTDLEEAKEQILSLENDLKQSEYVKKLEFEILEKEGMEYKQKYENLVSQTKIMQTKFKSLIKQQKKEFVKIKEKFVKKLEDEKNKTEILDSKYKSEHENLKQKIDEFEIRAQEYQHELDFCKKNHADQNVLNILDADLKLKSNQIKEYAQKIKELKLNIKKMECDKVTQKQEYDSLLEKHKSLSDESESLNEKLLKLNKEFEEYKTEYNRAQFKDEIENYKEEIHNYLNEIKSKNEQIKMVTDWNKESEIKIKDLKTTIQNLSLELKQKTSRYIEKLEEKNQKYAEWKSKVSSSLKEQNEMMVKSGDAISNVKLGDLEIDFTLDIADIEKELSCDVCGDLNSIQENDSDEDDDLVELECRFYKNNERKIKNDNQNDWENKIDESIEKICGDI